MKIAIIDYKMGNLFSVRNACMSVGLDPEITSDKHIILNADGIILPGVGAFATAMDQLRKMDLINPIKTSISQGTPFLGICLGMQLLFSESEEFGRTDGLDIIKGKVIKFQTGLNGSRVKVPHIGWNTIDIRKNSDDRKKMMTGIDDGAFMYFVHSYYSKPSNDDDILTTTEYGQTNYCSAVMRDNIIATQFHPEKSSQKGILIYKNWADIVKERSSRYEKSV